jgi:excisionase family DNA binding protein
MADDVYMTTNNFPLRLLTYDEVQERLGIKRSTVKILVGLGEIEKVEIVPGGRRVGFPEDSIDAYIARLRVRRRELVEAAK